MKKKFLSVLLLAVLVLLGVLPTAVFAQESTVTGGTWGGVDWTFEVTDTVNGTGKLTIAPTTKDPATLETNPITGEPYEVGWWRENVIYKNGSASAIGGQPYNAEKVTELVIEEGVTHIGSFAAQKMPLTKNGEVVIPSTVVRIGQETFQKSKITKLTFAEGSQLKCLGPGAFKELLITSVELPEGLECMHVWVFTGCSKLEHVHFPSTVTDVTDWEHVEYCGFSYKQGQYNGQSSIFSTVSSLKSITFAGENVKNQYGGYILGGNSLSACADLTYYTSAQDALDAAAEGEGTASLLRNVTVGAGKDLVIPEGVSLDLNGKTLTNNGSIANFGDIAGSGTLANNGMLGGGEESIAASVTLSGNASVDCYAITYTLNGGTVAGENPTFYMVGGSDITLINPTRAGYIFTGWSGTGLSGNGNMTVTLSNITQDQSFTAHWARVYDIWVDGVQITDLNTVIDTNDSANITAGSASYDPATNILTLDGFTFVGDGNVCIRFAENLSVQLIGANSIRSGAVAAIGCEVADVRLHVYGKNATASLAVSATAATPCIVADAIHFERCVVAVEATGAAFKADAVMITYGDMEVTCGADGVIVGFDTTTPLTLTLDGTYRVQAGASKASAALVASPNAATYAENAYVKIEKAHVVTLNYGTKSSAVQMTVRDGDATDLYPPVIDGYIFMGWYADADYETPFDLAAPIGADVTVYAKLSAAVAKIEGPVSNGLADTYTFIYTDGTTETFTILNGADAKTTEFRVMDNWLQWRYVGDAEWQTLIDLATLKSEDSEGTAFKVEDGERG